MTNETQNLDAMFADFNMDDVADLPEYVTYPAGAHQVKVKIKLDVTKPDAAKLAAGKVPQRFMRFDMAYVAPVELAAGVTAPDAGSMDSQTCWLDNEWGAGEAKAIIKQARQHFGTGNLKALQEQFGDGLDCVVITKHSWDKGIERTAENARTKIVSLAVM